MSETETLAALDLTQLTAGIIAAYVSYNLLQPAGMPEVIASVHTALRGLIVSVREESDPVEPATPAQIDCSIRPDALISFLNGRPYKSLKRHLAGHGFDPANYRRRFGLPDEYPMVAPNYAALRSTLARQSGLGRYSRNLGTNDAV